MRLSNSEKMYNADASAIHVAGIPSYILMQNAAAHIARAALEGIAFQTMDIVVAMEKDAGVKLGELKVDGGASRNNLMMQFQADVLGTKVVRPVTTETTAMGAAYLAGLAVGYWKDREDVIANQKIERTFMPQISEEERSERIKGWKKAVKRANDWAKD